jgi:hypothetical protein
METAMAKMLKHLHRHRHTQTAQLAVRKAHIALFVITMLLTDVWNVLRHFVQNVLLITLQMHTPKAIQLLDWVK